MTQNNGQTQEGATKTETTETVATAELTPEQQIEKLTADLKERDSALAASEQRTKSAEGRLKEDRGTSAVLERLTRIETDQKAARREQRREAIEASEIPEPERVKQRAAINVEEATERATAERESADLRTNSQLEAYIDGLSARAERRVRRTVDAGIIKSDDPTLKQAETDFPSLKTRDQYDDWFEKLTDYLEDSRDKHSVAAVKAATTQVEEDQQEQNRNSNTMNVGAGKAASSANVPVVNDDEIDKAWMGWEREHPDQPNPYDQQYRRVIRR